MAHSGICYSRAVPARAASRRPTITIVGPGNLGSALALTLSAAGYKVEAIAVRPGSKHLRLARALAKRIRAHMTVAGKQPLSSDIIWITVPDDAIIDVGRTLSQSGEWTGRVVFHSSGALSSDELSPLRARGARVASVHPMMTFVRSAVPEIKGVAFALEGDAPAVGAAKSVVSKLGGKPFVIEKANKVLYHVFGSFASPLVIALMASMEEVAIAAGIHQPDIRDIMLPLLRRTLANYLAQGAEAAFTGPMARGDAATVRKHLDGLKKLPKIRKVYRALAILALDNLPVGNVKTLAKELKATAP